MRDPRNYFINPFDNSDISFNEMAALTTDHIGKLGNQNTQSGGQWAGRLAATMTAMGDFDDTITDEMVQTDFRKARKQAKNDVRAGLPSAVENQVANWVRAAFGTSSPELVSVVGTGTSSITRLPDDEVNNYLQKVITGLTPLIGAGVDQQRLDDANALKSQWDAVYAASEQSTADKRLSEEERRAAKTALAGVLFDTLLDAVKANPGNPDVLGSFFTPALAGGPALSGGGGGGGSGGGGASSSSFPGSSSFPSSSFPGSSSFPSSSSSFPIPPSSSFSSSSSFPSSSSFSSSFSSSSSSSGP